MAADTKGKGGRLRVPPGHPRGREGRKLPSSLNLQETAMRRRMKMRKRRDNSLSPLSAP
jgi:hypothetical protein